MAVLTMETKGGRSETAVLGELAALSVFRLNGDRYLKLADRMVNGHMACVKLDTGSTFTFPYKTLVTPVKSATLTVEE